MNGQQLRVGNLTCLAAACLLALPAAATGSRQAALQERNPERVIASDSPTPSSAISSTRVAMLYSEDDVYPIEPTGGKEPETVPEYDEPVYDQSDDGVPEPKKKKHKDDDKDWVVPAIAIGAIAIAVIHNAMKKKPAPDPGSDPVDPGSPDPVADLLRNGPEFSGLYNASAFMMSGLAKGGWPIVVEFELPEPGHVELMIRTRTSETYRYRLDGGAVGRRHIVLPLPPDLADNLEPALIAVTATTAPGSGETLPGFRLLGLGCGPRAIGSVAIDKVTLSTPEIISSAGQTAAYSFFAHSSFENAVVDFMKVKDSVDGETYDWVNNHRLAGGVEANRWVGEQERLVWDGRSRDRQTSLGVHKVQVRVWHSEGDWVSAWSDSSVFVRE